LKWLDRTQARDLLLALTLATVGFAYVAWVLCHRAPWQSAPGNQWELGKLLLGTLLLWGFGLRVLRSPNERVRHRPGLLIVTVVAFVLALHWQFAGKLLGAHFSLTKKSLGSLSMSSCLALGSGVLIFLALSGLHLREAWRNGILGRYLGAAVLVIVVLAGISFVLRDSHHFHLHHYTWAGFLVPFARFSSPFSRTSQAFLFGLFVEGVAHWGMDGVWLPGV